MKPASESGIYSNLITLNRNMFLAIFKIDLVVMAVGLFYVFGFQSEFFLSASKGLVLLTGLIFISLMQSLAIKENSANLKFYLKLPLSRAKTLAGFYLAFTLPSFILFTGLVFFLGIILLLALDNVEPGIIILRYFKMMFLILFSKSLTVNGMMAMKFHFAAIIGYFIVLGIAASLIMILRELSTMLIPLPNEIFIFLFLIFTFLISFISVKRMEI